MADELQDRFDEALTALNADRVNTARRLLASLLATIRISTARDSSLPVLITSPVTLKLLLTLTLTIFTK